MEDYIGKGWGFPPHFNKNTQEVDMVSEEAEIEDSLAVLFSTRKGERLFLPDFGCNLDEYAFQVNSRSILLRIKEFISKNIKTFEPRITLENLDIDATDIREGKLNIHLFYTINATNKKYNMVYPYYLEN